MVLNGVISGAAAAALGGLLGGNIPSLWLKLVLGVLFMAAAGLRENGPTTDARSDPTSVWRDRRLNTSAKSKMYV